MKLIIVRHAKAENSDGRLNGHLDSPLSDVGRLQAGKVAERLKDERIDVIYVSDLARARDTAEAIRIYHPSAEFHILKELRERDVGEFEGKSAQDIGWTGPLKFNIVNVCPKNGETLDALYSRAKEFILSLRKHSKNKTILIVTHGGFIRALICVLEGKEPTDMHSMAGPENTAVIVYEDIEKSPHCTLYNSTEHLT